MLKSIFIRLILSNLLFILAVIVSYQNSYANLSELDRWNYIKSLIENRIKLGKELISELATKTYSEESLKEKFNLIASLTGENYSLFQNLLQKSRLTVDSLNDLGVLPVIMYKIKMFDYVPWVYFPERMAEGGHSFSYPLMVDKLAGLNQILSKLEIHFPREASSTSIDPAMVMTLYLRVDHQISDIQDMRKRFLKNWSERLTREDPLRGKIVGFLEDEIVQHNLGFLMMLRSHFFELLDVSQKRYLANFKKSRVIDISAFLAENNSKSKKFKTIKDNLKKELYALYQRVKFELEIKARENPNPELNKFLRFEVDKNQTINDIYYFEKVFLSILQKQCLFFDDVISKKFKELNEKLIEFSESSVNQNELFSDCLEFLTSVITASDNLDGQIAGARTPVDFDTDENLKVARDLVQNQELVDFTAYTGAKAIPVLFSLSDRFENLEKKGDSLLLQIKELKSTMKKLRRRSSKKSVSPKEEELKPSFEGKEEARASMRSTDSDLATDDLQHIHVDENGITAGLEDLSIITEGLDSQGGGALKSEFAQSAVSPTEMEELDRGATIFVQAIEDEYTMRIREKIRGRHLELLESIYSPQPPSVRFETLKSLVERCGGILQFDGRGSSHFHITLPGRYTGRSWKLHGGAHSSKIQRRALEGFRHAFRGVSEILGIKPTVELQH